MLYLFVLFGLTVFYLALVGHLHRLELVVQISMVPRGVLSKDLGSVTHLRCLVWEAAVLSRSSLSRLVLK
jgi:hypothetical protein